MDFPNTLGCWMFFGHFSLTWTRIYWIWKKNQRQTHLSDYKFNQKHHSLTIHGHVSTLACCWSAGSSKPCAPRVPASGDTIPNTNSPRKKEQNRHQTGGQHLSFHRSITQDCGVFAHFPEGFPKLELCLFHTRPYPLWSSSGCASILQWASVLAGNTTYPDWRRYCTPSSSLFYPLGMQSILC